MRSPASLLLRKRTMIAAVLCLMIFTATISVLMGISVLPKTMLGNADVYIITSKGSESVLNSRIESQLADMLLDNGFVTNASPEIFAFAEYRGEPVTIRGVDFGQFMSVERAVLASGRLPQDLSEALIGTRLAKRLSVEIGDSIPLVGSYSPFVAEARITGTIETSSGVGDELITSLTLSRNLVRMPANYVSIVRVIGDVDFLSTVFAPGTARFSIFDLSIPKKEIAVGSQVQVSLKVKNWGDADGDVRVEIVDRTEKITLFDSNLTIAAAATQTLTINHTFSKLGNHSITARCFGLLPQNITTYVTVRDPYLLVIAPEKVAQYNDFTVTVLDNQLVPIENATVDVGGLGTLKTNSSGMCDVNLTLPLGTLEIIATKMGYEDGIVQIEVVNSSSLPQMVDIQVYKITLTPATVKVRENCTVAVFCQNFGNMSGSRTITIYLNGNVFSQRSTYLKPLQIRVIYYNVSYTTSGDRTFTSDSISETLEVEPLYQINPGLVQFLLKFGGTGSLDPSRGNLIYSTAKISEANIVIVLVSLAVLSATLVTLGVSSSFMKEINDNARIIGILRSIGASSRQLLWMMFRQAFILSLPAAAAGLIGGMLLAYLVSLSERLLAFGHVVYPMLDPSLIFAAATGCIAICVGSSLIAGLSVSRRAAIRMIRGTREEALDRPTLRELLGEE
ncbi:MAG: FtsX-like permease family protein [Thermoplasmata archaeon]